MDMDSNENHAWLTTEEAAKHLRLATRTIYNKVHEREIPFHKRGGVLRFRREELDAWLRGEWTSDAA